MTGRRPARLGPLFLSLAFAVLALAPARAEFDEAPFAPAIGSRWTIADAQDSVTRSADGSRHTQSIRQTSEATFDEKLAEGWRVTFVVKSVTVAGDAPAVAIMAPALKSMEGMRFEGVLDQRGKPVEIRDIDQARARMTELVEATARAFADKPQVAGAMRSMMTSLLVLDGRAAAETYLEPLNLMSTAQGTGLKPGDARSETASKPNPLGGEPLTSVSVTRLAQPDGANGATVVTRTESFEPESLKTATLAVARRLLRDLGGATTISERDVENVVSKLNVSLEGLGTFEVREGMARSIAMSSATKLSAMGKEFAQEEKRRLTVSPAP